MPAAAVIPAPVAYIKVVAVKKLVVGYMQNMIVCSHSREANNHFCTLRLDGSPISYVMIP